MVRLTELHRFTDTAEAAATLAVRSQGFDAIMLLHPLRPLHPA